jgi:hypothetical protein
MQTEFERDVHSKRREKKYCGSIKLEGICSDCCENEFLPFQVKNLDILRGE